MVFFVVVFF